MPCEGKGDIAYCQLSLCEQGLHVTKNLYHSELTTHLPIQKSMLQITQKKNPLKRTVRHYNYLNVFYQGIVNITSEINKE